MALELLKLWPFNTILIPTVWIVGVSDVCRVVSEVHIEHLHHTILKFDYFKNIFYFILLRFFNF